MQWDNHLFWPAGYAVLDELRMLFALLDARAHAADPCWAFCQPEPPDPPSAG